MNLIGALRRAMATTGYTELKEFQRVEVVVAVTRRGCALDRALSRRGRVDAALGGMSLRDDARAVA